MGFQNGYKAFFFIEPFVTDSKQSNFYIALIYVFLHMYIYTLASYTFKGNLVLKTLNPFFMFFNMFLIMCYNRWIIIAYIIGETLGYATFRIYSQNLTKTK